MKKQFKKVQEKIEILLRMLDGDDYYHVYVSEMLKDIYGNFLKLKYDIKSKEKKKDK